MITAKDLARIQVNSSRLTSIERCMLEQAISSHSVFRCTCMQWNELERLEIVQALEAAGYHVTASETLLQVRW